MAARAFCGAKDTHTLVMDHLGLGFMAYRKKAALRFA
jgi:hypothetical protein